jgi:hypothetical protein
MLDIVPQLARHLGLPRYVMVKCRIFVEARLQLFLVAGSSKCFRLEFLARTSFRNYVCPNATATICTILLDRFGCKSVCGRLPTSYDAVDAFQTYKLTWNRSVRICDTCKRRQRFLSLGSRLAPLLADCLSWIAKDLLDSSKYSSRRQGLVPAAPSWFLSSVRRSATGP